MPPPSSPDAWLPAVIPAGLHSALLFIGIIALALYGIGLSSTVESLVLVPAVFVAFLGEALRVAVHTSRDSSSHSALWVAVAAAAYCAFVFARGQSPELVETRTLIGTLTGHELVQDEEESPHEE